MASIRNDLSFSPAEVPWINSGYSLSFGGFLLLGGKLGDIYGRGRTLIAGALISAFFSLLSAFSPDPALFVISQVLKGIGTALLLPNTFALINNLFVQGQPRHRALGVFAFCSEAGYAAGNFFGGVLSGYSWRTVLIPSALFGLCILYLSMRSIPKDKPTKSPGSLDFLGALLSSAGFATLILAITNCLEWGIYSPTTLLCAGSSAILLFAFFWRIHHHASPLLPPELLRNRYIVGAGGVIFFLTAAGVSIFIQVVLYMQDVLKFSPEATGTALLPLVVMSLTSSFLINRFLDGFGFRLTILAGLLALLISFLCFSTLTVASSYWFGLFPMMLFYNLSYPLPIYGVRAPAGMGTTPEKQGIAYAINLALEQFGITFGVTISAAANLAARHGDDSLPALVNGFHVSTGVSCAFITCAILITLFLLTPVKKALSGNESCSSTEMAA